MDKIYGEIAVIAVIIISRLLSHFEHKKTEKDVTEIKVYINGELEKKLEEAKEQGRQEERNKHLKKNL